LESLLIWKVLNCAAEGWRRPGGRIVWKMKKCYTASRETEICCPQYTEGRLTGSVILRRNCLLKHVIEGKKEGMEKVAERRGRRRNQILNDHEEQIGYCKLKYEALDCTLWGSRFGRRYGSVGRRTT
jgi:hypothetical protein